MAHPCKCVNCGRQFDRDKVPFIQVSSRRYAHKKCPDGPIDQTEVDKANLNKYLYVLYNGKYDYARTNLLIKKYVTELGFTYSGIHKALIYFYEVQGNTIEDEASRSIGIVPYVYEDAKNYYYKMWSVNKRNSEVNIEDYIPKTINVTIPQPQRKVKKPKKKFSFLDEEEVDVNGK